MKEKSRRSFEGTTAYMGDLLDTLTQRGRSLLRRRGAAASDPDLVALGEMLLSRRGEASGVALAQRLLAAFAAAGEARRLEFLRALADRFGPDPVAVDAAMAALSREEDRTEALEALHVAAEPRRQGLFRRLNLAPRGASALLRMREELLEHLRAHPELRRVDVDFAHLFGSWFNRGFLVLRPIDWTTPARILEKIIRYEAVRQVRKASPKKASSPRRPRSASSPSQGPAGRRRIAAASKARREERSSRNAGLFGILPRASPSPFAATGREPVARDPRENRQEAPLRPVFLPRLSSGACGGNLWEEGP